MRKRKHPQNVVVIVVGVRTMLLHAAAPASTVMALYVFFRALSPAQTDHIVAARQQHKLRRQRCDAWQGTAAHWSMESTTTCEYNRTNIKLNICLVILCEGHHIGAI